MNEADIIIKTECDTLSDGSHAFNVSIRDNHGSVITLAAMNERHADELSQKIADAINEHTAMDAMQR